MSTWLGSDLSRLCAVTVLALSSALYTSGANLEGQNKGDTTTWSSVNLQGWLELDYVPLHIYFPSGSAGNQTVQIDFPHYSGTIPGFENLVAFKPFTANVQFVSLPTLTTDPSGTWSYTFTLNISDQNPAEVRFFARIAAGAHLNGGSSLQLKSSAGNLQIHKPNAGPGEPDLAITTTGPTTVQPGEVLTYSLTYTNLALTNSAAGVQVSDLLPSQLIVLTNALPANAQVVGNTIFWDLGTLAPQTGGRLTLPAVVDPATLPGTVLTNLAQVLSSENDLNPSDNASTALATVVCDGAVPAILSSPASVTACPGSSVTFSVTAGGALGMAYQWNKNGTAIAGATDSTYTISAVTAADAGLYDVAVSTSCGSVSSGSAVLNLNRGLPAAITQQLFLADGTLQLQFSTGCGGTYYVQYSADLVTWKTYNQPVAGNGSSAQWIDAGPPATDSLPSAQKARFYRVIQVP